MATSESDVYREIEKVLSQANKLKLDYIGVRLQDLQTNSLSRENGKLERISSGNELGIGIRVITNGKMGFYSSNDFNPNLVFRKALKLAKKSKKKAIFKTIPLKIKLS